MYFVTISAEAVNVELFLFKVRVNHLIAFLLFVFLLLQRGRMEIDRRLFIPLLTIAAAFVLASLFSPLPLRSLGYVGVFGLTVAFYFLLPINLLMALDRKVVLRLYMMSFIPVGVFAALQVLFSLAGVILPFVTQYLTVVARGQGLSYEPSYYALYMTAFTMYCNALFLMQRKNLRRWAAMIFANFLLVFSTSTGVIFALPIFMVIYGIIPGLLGAGSVCHGRRGQLLIFALFVVVMMGAIAFFFFDEFMVSFFKFFDIGFFTHWSFLDRWIGLVGALEVFYASPWLGVGAGGVGPYLFAMMNGGALPFGLEEVEIYDPKNAFTELLASVGVVGAIGYLFFSVRIFTILKRALKKIEDKSEQQAILALVISFCCSLCVLQFNQGLFRSYIWLSIAIAVGYALSSERQRKKDL
jgi:hypothetical protein